MKQQITTLLTGGFLALTLFGDAAAGQLEDGYAAYNRGDNATALQLIRPLADQGNATAQYDLGLIHLFGEGVPGYAQAIIWFRKAADQRNVLAQYWLAMMYREGEGVPQDYAQAAMWFRKAADQGDILCQMEIGEMYRDGQGVSQDLIQAYMWFNLASSRETNYASREGDVKLRDEIAAKMTPAQIAEAQRMAREWVAK
jgi:hypothetical protein